MVLAGSHQVYNIQHKLVSTDLLLFFVYFTDIRTAAWQGDEVAARSTEHERWRAYWQLLAVRLMHKYSTHTFSM